MSIRTFASHIGVSHRMISKWERGGDQVRPRPGTQEVLDTMFATATADVKDRFLAALRVAPAPATSDHILPAAEPTMAVTHPGDGRLMTPVDDGIFLSGPEDKPVWLNAFYIDVYPVTHGAYHAFIEATGREPPKLLWENGKPPPELLDHPVVHVTWHDAAAYADWAGKQLPTSLQWEKATRGTAGNPYPWGRQPTWAKCNVRESGNGATTPVDCYQSGVSPYGVYDLCGNTWEWCSTSSSEGRRELKGSAFTSPFDRCTPSRYNDASEHMSDDDTGFRCISARLARP